MNSFNQQPPADEQRTAGNNHNNTKPETPNHQVINARKSPHT
uniref:Uncharacterized protein n=1 Tax=Serratia phage Spe5P4 TaxID=3159438 RepID=A0AAU7VI95_9CAUD